MNKKFTAVIAVFLAVFFLGGDLLARPRHGHRPPPPPPRHHYNNGYYHRPAPPPRYHDNYRYRHHDRGPSRGWYNSALVIDATLGVLDIATRAYESRNYRRANTCTTTIVTPPSVVTTQPVAPTVYVPQVVTPQPIYLPQPVQTYTLPATYNVTQPVQQIVTPSGVIYR